MHNELEKCPITLGTPLYPALASDRVTYDFCALVGWLITNGNQSPNTRQPIANITIPRFSHDISDESAEDIALNYSKLIVLYPEIQVHGVLDSIIIKSKLVHQPILQLFSILGANEALIREQRESLFYIAALKGNLEIMKMLHSLGMDINRKHRDTGVTALHLAIEQNNIAIVRWLLEQAACDLNIQRTDTGSTPLDTAALHNRQEIVRLLINDPRIRPNTRRTSGKVKCTPLDIATQKLHYQCMCDILSHPETDIGMSLGFAHKKQDAQALNILLNAYLARMLCIPEQVNEAFRIYPDLSIAILNEYRTRIWEKITRMDGFELSEDYYNVIENGTGEQIKSLNKARYAELLTTIFLEEGKEHPLKRVILHHPIERSSADPSLFGRRESPSSIAIRCTPQPSDIWISTINSFLTTLTFEDTACQLTFS